MNEILKKIKDEIEDIKKEEEKLNTLTENSEKARLELEELKDERTKISDTESGFYKDLTEQIDKKNTEFSKANIERMSKTNELEYIVASKKTEILKSLEEDKQKIDENRNAKFDGLNLDKLKSEKEDLEKQIELSKIMGGTEQFDKMTESEKKEVRNAHNTVLINKKRLEEIAPTIELMELFGGKEPKERFLEISSMMDTVKKEFNRKKLSELSDKISKELDVKEEQPENKIEEAKVEVEKDETKPEIKAELESGNKEEKVEYKEKTKIDKIQPITMEKPQVKSENENHKEKPDEDLEFLDDLANKVIGETQKSEDLKNIQSKNDIKISYNAKYDQYLLYNQKTNENKIINRKDLKGISKHRLAAISEKQEDELINVDTNIFEVLYGYDKEKATKYFKAMTTLGKTANERQKQMSDDNLDISYDLRGLFDKKVDSKGKKQFAFTSAERRTLLEMANNAKTKGIASVKKGAKVTLRELMENIAIKTRIVKLLPEYQREQKKEEEYSKLTNRDYMETLDQKYQDALEKKQEDSKNTKKIVDKAKRIVKSKPKKFKQNSVKLSYKIRNSIARTANSFADKIKVDEDVQQKISNVTKNPNNFNRIEKTNNIDKEEIK